MSFGGNSQFREKSLSNSKNQSTSLHKTYAKNSKTPPKGYEESKLVSEQLIQKSLHKNREKMCNTLDTFTLILQSNAPLRCLQHNSVLSLYCETQQKLLCANCVYRNNSHRSHKVHPIEQCYRMLARDLERLQRQAQREIDWLNQSEETINNIFKEEEKDASQTLIALAHEFEEIEIELRRYFESIKAKIVNTLNSVNFNQEKLLLEIGFYRDIFRESRLPKKQELTTLDEQQLKFFHLVGNTLVNYTKMSKHKLRFKENRIKTIQNNQLKKLGAVKDSIKTWIMQKQQQLKATYPQHNRSEPVVKEPVLTPKSVRDKIAMSAREKTPPKM